MVTKGKKMLAWWLVGTHIWQAPPEWVSFGANMKAILKIQSGLAFANKTLSSYISKQSVNEMLSFQISLQWSSKSHEKEASWLQFSDI